MWGLFEVFSNCATQWHVSPTGQRTGLIYPSCAVVAKAYGIKINKDFFAMLRCLEVGAITAFIDGDISELLDG